MYVYITNLPVNAIVRLPHPSISEEKYPVSGNIFITLYWQANP